jgi:hypothetical protein
VICVKKLHVFHVENLPGFNIFFDQHALVRVKPSPGTKESFRYRLFNTVTKIETFSFDFVVPVA